MTQIQLLEITTTKDNTGSLSQKRKRGWVIYNELFALFNSFRQFLTKTDFNQPENLEYDPLFGGKEISPSGIFLNMPWSE